MTKHDVHMWNLESGRFIASVLETALLPLGFHVALGGSTLHKGLSTKDLDIFLYDRSNATQASVEDVLREIKKYGIEQDEECATTSVSGDRYVYRCWQDWRRIDIFFLVKLSDEDNQYSKPKPEDKK